jgi:hypothetical protein
MTQKLPNLMKEWLKFSKNFNDTYVFSDERFYLNCKGTQCGTSLLAFQDEFNIK